MVEGKALVDTRKVNDCDLKGECVEVCPTNVVSINIKPAEEGDLPKRTGGLAMVDVPPPNGDGKRVERVVEKIG